MAVSVRIPTPLRKFTNGQGEIKVEAHNISELVGTLEKNFPGMKSRLCDDAGQIRKFINVFINEEDIRFKENMNTILKDGDDISIVPAIAGGIQGYPNSDIGIRVKSPSRLKYKAAGDFVIEPYITRTVRSKIVENAVVQNELAISNPAKAGFRR